MTYNRAKFITTDPKKPLFWGEVWKPQTISKSHFKNILGRERVREGILSWPVINSFEFVKSFNELLNFFVYRNSNGSEQGNSKTKRVRIRLRRHEVSKMTVDNYCSLKSLHTKSRCTPIHRVRRITEQRKEADEPAVFVYNRV